LRNCVQMPRRETRNPRYGDADTPYRIVAHWMSTLRGTGTPFNLSLYEGQKQKALYLEMFMDVPGDPWGVMASFTPEGDLRFDKSTIYGEGDELPILVPNDQVKIFSCPYDLLNAEIHVPPPNWCTYVARSDDGAEIQMHLIGHNGQTAPHYASVVRVVKKHFPVLTRLPHFAGKIRKRR